MHERAAEVHEWLQANPEATVSEIAAEHGMDEAEVIEMLEGHAVEGGVIREVAPGAGGGWVSAPERASE